MGRRKADEKILNVERNEQERDRVELERDKWEWERQKEIYTAASAASGVYLMVRTAQNAVDLQTSVTPPSLVEAFRALLGADDAEISEAARKFLRADPFALSYALFAAALVLSGFDPSDIVGPIADAASPV